MSVPCPGSGVLLSNTGWSEDHVGRMMKHQCFECHYTFRRKVVRHPHDTAVPAAVTIPNHDLVVPATTDLKPIGGQE